MVAQKEIGTIIDAAAAASDVQLSVNNYQSWEVEINTQNLPEHFLILSVVSILFAIKFLSQKYFQATCATNGDGLYEGLDWLSNQLKNASRRWK